MKIKELIFSFLISVLVYLSITGLIGGVKLTGTFTYSLMILVIFAFFSHITTSIRKFFILPNAIYVDVLVNISLLLIFFWAINSWVGGIKIISLKPFVVEFIQSIFARAKIGDFGTITIVSICLATVYQTLIFLSNDK